MASSLSQTAFWDPNPSTNGVADSAFVVTFANATVTGSTLVSCGTISNFAGTTITAVADSVNGAWTTVDHKTDTGNQDGITSYLQNAGSVGAGSNGLATGGSATTLVDTSKSWTTNQWAGKNLFNLSNVTNVTVSSNTATTLTFPSTSASASGNVYAVGDYVKFTTSAFDDYPGGVIAEVAGVVTTGGLAGHNAAIATVSGTNSATSGTAALGSSPVMVLGFSFNDSTGTSPYEPAAGTGFTSAGTGWQWNLSGPTIRMEYENVANPGTKAATFTPSGSDNFVTFMVALLDAASSSNQASIAWVT
jgi:hypothetical protein